LPGDNHGGNRVTRTLRSVAGSTRRAAGRRLARIRATHQRVHARLRRAMGIAGTTLHRFRDTTQSSHGVEA
jgi:hypothetical protein